ncbi:uncharacterized protein B0T23DRAFT_383266 [Neurospora hispaniola]|uniref:Uncharacterized protein n=1 Tax=Neurospora hispaniola TaxID=588809 RepID=A0AAJ0I6U2_9PEZI|nr:hypothetical protein B0T23DRAFT_383266 [Neurospora hispaniola]
MPLEQTKRGSTGRSISHLTTPTLSMKTDGTRRSSRCGEDQMCANWKRGKRAQEQTEESARTGVVGLLQGRTGRWCARPGGGRFDRMLEDGWMDAGGQIDSIRYARRRSQPAWFARFFSLGKKQVDFGVCVVECGACSRAVPVLSAACGVVCFHLALPVGLPLLWRDGNLADQVVPGPVTHLPPASQAHNLAARSPLDEARDLVPHCPAQANLFLGKGWSAA